MKNRARDRRPAAADKNRAQLAAVARLYYLDNLGQHEIAEIVGISRSQVSRLLARARELGIVRISVDEYDPRARDLEAQLVERLGLRHAIVVGTQAGAAEPIRRTTGYFAAPAVSQLVRANMTLGIAGGRTLAELVRFMAPGQEVRGITVVQLMGNIGPSASSIDSVELSRALAQRFDGAFYTINAPAFVQDRATREVFLAHEHMQLVWNLFGSLQLALVGIGSLEESAFIERGVLGSADLAKLRAQGAAGEICGRFFDASGRECRSDYRDRVVSIDLDSLRRCPEVVAVTTGARRAAAIRAALRGSLISSLVIDDRGAEALLS